MDHSEIKDTLKNAIRIGLLALILMIVTLSFAHADWYVAVNGSDTNDGQTIDTPLASFGQLFTNLTQGTGGVNVFVRGGLYWDNDGTTLNKSFASRVTIMPYQNEKVYVMQGIVNFYNLTTTWTLRSGSFGGLNVWEATFATGASTMLAVQNDTKEILYVYLNNASVSNTSQPNKGIFFDTGPDKIYLRLNDSTNPNTVPYIITKNDGWTLTGTKNLTINGLIFQGGYKCIYFASGGNDVNVKNNTFYCPRPMDIRSSANSSFYNNSGYERHGNYSWRLTKDSAASNERSCIYMQDGLENLKIYDNHCEGYYNGIYTQANTANDYQDLQVHDNYVNDIYDDAIEIENFHNQGNWTRNHISDAFAGFSLAPARGSTPASIIEYNTINATKSVWFNGAANFDTQSCFKASTSQLSNISATHNTCIGRGIYGDTTTNVQGNNTWKDNIFWSTDSIKRIFDRVGLRSSGVYFDYNLLYVSGGADTLRYYDEDSTATSFATLAAWKASALYNGVWDNHSQQFNPQLDVNFKPADYTSACIMSSTGSYVGAVFCAPIAISNIQVTSLNNQSIFVTWSETTGIDTVEVRFNTTTDLYYNNVTPGTNQINMTGLLNGTFHTIKVIPRDSLGLNGTIATITNQTLQNPGINFTGNISANCIIPGACIFNATFLQKPFIVNGWITTGWIYSNSYNITQDTSEEACTNLASCSSGDDSDFTTSADDNTHSTSQFAFNFSYIDSRSLLTLNLTIRGTNNNNRFIIGCTGYGSFINFSDVLVQSTYQVTTPDSCKTGGKVQYYIDMQRAAGYVQVYEVAVIEKSNITLSVDGSNVFNSYNITNRTVNITEISRANVDDAFLVFMYNSTVAQFINYNTTYDVIYNKSINISTRDLETNATLNPSCTYNSATITPKSDLLSYVSSLDNELNCSLAGYASFSYDVNPIADAYNLTMGGININITLLDEQTNEIINGPLMFVYLIRESYAVNYSTSNGTLNLGYVNIPSGDIEIRYGGPGYVTRSYYLTSLSSSSLDLYDLKETNASLVVFTVTDEKGKPVNGAYLKAQRYFISDNAYKLVSMEKTDINGEAGLYLEPYTVPYIFIVEKDGRVVFTSSPSGTKIFTTTVALRVNLLSDVLESFYNLNNYLTVSLTFDNSTKIFTYIWDDTSNTVASGCLEIERHTNVGVSTIGPTCTSSASGTININVSSYWANNTRFLAKGNLETNTQFSPFPSQILEIITLNPIFEALGKPGLFFAYIFIITMFFIGLAVNLPVAVIYTSASMLVLNIIGFALFGWAMIISITILGLIYGLMTR